MGTLDRGESCAQKRRRRGGGGELWVCVSTSDKIGKWINVPRFISDRSSGRAVKSTYSSNYRSNRSARRSPLVTHYVLFCHFTQEVMIMNVAKSPSHVFSTTGMLCISAKVWHVDSSLLFPALWHLHLGQSLSLNQRSLRMMIVGLNTLY